MPPNKKRFSVGKKNTNQSKRSDKEESENHPGRISSDSEGEGAIEATPSGLSRKVSTQKQLKSKVCIKEGYLLKQTSSSFQKSRSRYFKLRPRKLYYAKHEDSEIFNEIDLADSSVAERSTKIVNCSFSIIGPFHSLILSAHSRREMDEWISAIRAVQAGEFYSPHQVYMDNFSDGHNWYACTHNRPTYCNVCRDVLSGVMNHGLSCDVCKFKAHKRCATKAPNNCKWATLATVGKQVIEDEEGLWAPHQWLEGNLPVSAKCVVCEKTCGSVLRLQDLRCLWCRSVVHTACKSSLPRRCSLGSCRLSIVPPTSIHSQDSDDYWQASPSTQCTSPLLVFVNSKSGDNQGVKFVRRFRQFLNPAQVFDLMTTEPQVGLKMFRKFDTFRILICGGDGSIGWVLSEVDKFKLHSKAQVGVLPLGTGNDLAQVMGWGNVCDDDTQVPAIIERYERASAKLLDRWSIKTYEGKMPIPLQAAQHIEPVLPMIVYEHTVCNHLATMLNSEQISEVLSSATVLCETVKDFVTKVGSSYTSDNDPAMAQKCQTLDEKLASLLSTLTVEAKMAESEQIEESNKEKIIEAVTTAVQVSEVTTPVDAPQVEIPPSGEKQTRPTIQPSSATEDKSAKKRSKVFEQKSQLMLRANSLKKAVRQIIEHTEHVVDEQNEQTKPTKLSIQIEEEEDPGIQEAPCCSSARSEEPGAAKEDDRIFSGFSTLSVSNDPRLVSKSAPTTPTGTLEQPSFHEYRRQTSEMPKISQNLLNKDYMSFSASGPECERRVTKGSSFPNYGSQNKPKIIINPMYKQQPSGGFLSRVLLAHADALCAPATPLFQADHSLSDHMFTEKCVMNNYFGIGLDAKISLDFHRKREEHTKKCSRTKNFVWYGMLGLKELASKTYMNLEQRIRLECDGQHVPLPPIQGIVVLNIPSFMGGANLWGGKSGNEVFNAPSYNDKILEVVAVFSTVQLGMALVISENMLQHHRIAQCRSVKITILGDEEVPLQTDGEAWLQPPGIVRIEHKNRIQMLARDRALEAALKTWEDKQKYSEKSLSSNYLDRLSDSEVVLVKEFVETTCAVAMSLSDNISQNNVLREEINPAVTTAVRLSTKLRPSGHVTESANHSLVAEYFVVIKEMRSQISSLLKKHNDLDSDTSSELARMVEFLEVEINKLSSIKWIAQIEQHSNEEVDQSYYGKTHGRSSGRFKLTPLFRKSARKDNKAFTSNEMNVTSWTTGQVSLWLDTLQLSDYKELFERNDIQGRELLKLDTQDLKELGIHKMGHIKRIQAGIRDLHNS